MKSALIASLAFAASLFFAATAAAGPVRIQAGGEEGAGIAVRHGSQCYVIAPIHVVESAGAIRPGLVIIDDAGNRARDAQEDTRHPVPELSGEAGEDGVAVLTVTAPTGFHCSTDWDEGAGALQLANSSANAISGVIQSGGGVRRPRLRLADSTGASTLTLEPYTPGRDDIRSGDSGSTVTAGDRTLGMIISVSTAENPQRITVLRQDVINGYMRDRLTEAHLRHIYVIPTWNNNRVLETGALALARGLSADPRFDASVYTPTNVRRARWDDEVPVPPGADYYLASNVVQIARQQVQNPAYANAQATYNRYRTSNNGVGRFLRDGAAQQLRTTPRYIAVYTVEIIYRLVDARRGQAWIYSNRRQYNVDTTEPAAVAQSEVLEAALRADAPNILREAGL